MKTVPVTEAVGMVIAHDITEIIPGKFKGRAFKKGHIVRAEDVCHLQRLGKENLFILEMKEDEMHENDAAYAIANALAGNGVKLDGEPREGRINLVAEIDGLLKVDRKALFKFNMLGEVMCATIHNNSVVKKGQVVAGTRAIPLVVKKSVVEKAVAIARGKKEDKKFRSLEDKNFSSSQLPNFPTSNTYSGVIEVKEMRKPKAGIVITGNEVYYGRVKDAFGPVITKKIMSMDGEVVGVYFAPDDAKYIEDRIKELIAAGADLIITTGGMSVDPDDITRFAIRNIGVDEFLYGTPVLPGAMFLIAYLEDSNKLSVTSNEIKHEKENPSLVTRHSSFIPILGIPACGMYSNITVFDIILPRVLAGERISREELAELGHGGLCLKCSECRYPVCPFGK
ncbi:MAG TPA: molybdopterin-binding protein [Thermodesulfovibrionia bacterium]|nr:molybdopterin-binding protein [Thermodesulfovibrionia bacterium]